MVRLANLAYHSRLLCYTMWPVAGLLLGSAGQPAKAQNIVVPVAGIFVPGSADTLGIFGAPGGDLSNKIFSINVTYNPALFSTPFYSFDYESPIAGAMTMSITANGKTFSLASTATTYPDESATANFLTPAVPVYSILGGTGLGVDFSTIGNSTFTQPAPPQPNGLIEVVIATPAGAEILAGTISTFQIISPFLVASGTGLGDIELSTLVDKQAGGGNISATGLAADGTSAAIVFLPTGSSNPVTFTTNNGTCLLPYDPSFLQKAPTQACSPLPPVTPIQIGSSLYAAALLQAPPAGAMPSYTTPVQVTAQQDNQIQQLHVPLVPPPIVLVHGIWGSSKSLANVKSYLTSIPPWQNQRGLVVPIQYTNDIAFDSAEPGQALGAEIHNILRADNAQGVVVGRVDIVAHSMGALVARHYSTLPDYKAIFDRTEGRFHTIITLDAPEAGSELAAYLFTHAGDWYGLNGADSFVSESGPPSHTWPWTIWNAACGDVLHTTTVEVCFAGSKLNSPLAPAGQPLTSGAVYSLIPGGKSISKLPPANIPNALWLAVSSLRPASDGYSGESALQFELESLIAATYKNQSKAETISSILNDQGQDDVIVPLASQKAGALPGQFATISDLSHNPPADPGWLVKYGLGLSLANVENNSSVNALIGCWLVTDGAASCIAANATIDVSRPVHAPTKPLSPREKSFVNRTIFSVPNNIRLAKPFGLRMKVIQSHPTHLSVTQVDKFGHVDTAQAKLSRVEGGIADIEVLPVLFGSVSFTVNAEFEDGSYSSNEFRATVGVPDAQPIVFHADFNNWKKFYLSLAEGGDFGELHPEARFASAPSQKVSLDGLASFAFAPGADASVIQLNNTGSFRALREGVTTIEARFGEAVTHVDVIVEDTRPR